MVMRRIDGKAWAIAFAALAFILIYYATAKADSSWGGGGASTLQQVTDKGATTTAEISVNGVQMDLDDYITFDATESVKLGVATANPTTLFTNAGLQVYDTRSDAAAHAFQARKSGTGNTLNITQDGAGMGIYVDKTNTGGGEGIKINMGSGANAYALHINNGGSGTSIFNVGGASIADQQISSFYFKASTGNHYRAQSSLWADGDGKTVAVLTNDGGLALGWDVAASGLGNPATSISQNILIASGSVGVKGNLNATGTAYFGGLVTATAGVNFGASGGGTTFDYYYEGTWVPTYDGVTSGDCATGTAATGTYTQVGNVVNADMIVTVTGCAVTPTGVTYVTLPKAVKSADYTGACAIGYISDYDQLSDNNIMTATMFSAAGDDMRIYQTPVGGGTASGAPADTAWTGYFHCTYLTD